MTLKPGTRVRIVEMRGCMADVRRIVYEGNVTCIVNRKVYGSANFEPYARIVMDDGRHDERPAVSRLWTEHDGAMEYRY